jgi:hypothetical protein
MIKNKEKQFDCIKMKNSIQARIYAETHNMSKEELLNYFNKNTQTIIRTIPAEPVKYFV